MKLPRDGAKRRINKHHDKKSAGGDTVLGKMQPAYIMQFIIA